MTRIVLILAVLLELNDAVFNVNDVSTYLSYDLSYLGSPAVRSIIEKASKDLKDSGAFIIPQFIKPDLRNLMANELKSVQHIPRTTTRTVFQDKGDFVNFDESSPRNFMMENSMEFVSRLHMEEYVEKTGVESVIIKLYHYEPIVEFWRKIINDTQLFISTDKAGSVYGFYGQIGDWFSWHFDESPFSCIFMIETPESGGYFRYILTPNPKLTPNAGWNELGNILNNEESVKDRIKSIIVNEGDTYCMFGNQSLHEVVKVEGDKPRSVFVMTYGNTEHFEHSSNVNNLNQWNDNAAKNEL